MEACILYIIGFSGYIAAGILSLSFIEDSIMSQYDKLPLISSLIAIISSFFTCTAVSLIVNDSLVEKIKTIGVAVPQKLKKTERGWELDKNNGKQYFFLIGYFEKKEFFKKRNYEEDDCNTCFVDDDSTKESKRNLWWILFRCFTFTMHTEDMHHELSNVENEEALHIFQRENEEV